MTLPALHRSLRRALLCGAAIGTVLLGAQNPRTSPAETSVKVGGATFTAKGLVGIGRMPANLRDKFGETFGSSSGMAVETASWQKTATGYTGTLLLLPDRGYNVAGTTDYRARLNTVTVTFTPVETTGTAATGQAGIVATLKDSLLLADANGAPLTGLDPTGVRAAAAGFPELPEAVNGHVSFDAEALVRMPDGSFFISDEYGPYIYRFSAEGKMLGAIRPPDALIPIRKGTANYSANAPGPGGKPADPANPETGRQNNQGLEGLSLTPDGKFLIALLQSATRQDGGDSPATRRHTRAFVYDIATIAAPKLTAEYVVPLPVFKDAKGAQLVAAQSEIVALSDSAFLMLARDSGNGYGMPGDTSLYRRVEIVDLAAATNIAGTAYDGTKPVAPKGVLEAGVTAATVSDFIDLIDTAELGRFGLHSGPPNDRNNPSEKWESMGLASVLDPAHPDDYFLFIGNDNDFITQDGFQVGAPYKDASGADVDTMLMAYRVIIPTLAKK